MKDKIYVFVYGSLKNDFENHFWLEENVAKFVCNAFTSDNSFDMVSVKDSYPSVVKGDNKITGEIYEIDKNCLYALDYLEGYPEYYNRQLFSFDTKTNGKMEALMYIMNNNAISAYKKYIKKESPRIIRDNGYATWKK